MTDLQRTVRSELGEITTPVLVLEGGRDETTAPRAPSMLEAGLGSSRKAWIRFERSGHVLTEDVEAAAVLDAVERFFAAHAAG